MNGTADRMISMSLNVGITVWSLVGGLLESNLMAGAVLSRVSLYCKKTFDTDTTILLRHTIANQVFKSTGRYVSRERPL